MENSSTLFIRDPRCAMIVGQTGCGKTEFILDLIETVYLKHFHNIIIICPTLPFNAAYKSRPWVNHDRCVFTLSAFDDLHDILRKLFNKFKNTETLYIIDDCAARKDMRRKNMLSELAFSGRHALQTVWILTQKYNSVLTDFREQVKWICFFYCKDRDSFENCLRENDVIPRAEHVVVRNMLKSHKHSKVVLRTEQPTAYQVFI